MYEFILGLEDICLSLRKSKKEIERMLKLENVEYNDKMTGYEKRRN